MCQTALFSDFRYPQNGGGGMLSEALMSDPDFVQKAFPQQSEGFSEGRRLGAPHTIEL